MLSMVGCIETYADSISVQRTSRRQPRPIDFRAVQGAINADGAGSFIAGVLGTVPNTVYSTSVAVVEMTGIAARRVGWWGGLFLVLLAFCPKIAALVGAMPGPVAGAFVLMNIGDKPAPSKNQLLTTVALDLHGRRGRHRQPCPVQPIPKCDV